MARFVEAQVDYGRSDLALASARAIVVAKIRNSELLLTNYRQSRARAGLDQAALIRQAQNQLASLRQRALGVTARSQLFQVEALAANIYWETVAMLCHQSMWRRVYPHATDSLNILLNTGYTFLARRCGEAIDEVGLLPELGLLHGENSENPLIYDLMECFRQVSVDAVIIPVFARRPQSGVAKDGKAFKKILALLASRYEKRFYYQHRCEKLGRIIYLEALNLRSAILAKRIWRPYQHRWNHRRRC